MESYCGLGVTNKLNEHFHSNNMYFYNERALKSKINMSENRV